MFKPIKREIANGERPQAEAAERRALRQLAISFFLFGLINNGTHHYSATYGTDSYYTLIVLYVIVLSAALDLVPPSTPKGLVALCNIAPSLVHVNVMPLVNV
jgi:battenin